ncbi:hypothetical protein Bcep1808_6151 [Burkholderia vietnamiensis G4]|uniref:Uncharacterized protein n=1 Tax=Burkholderia vietnamiensis (strain G4 / LMG 22486) TaxID=269482 RepID=A4JS11_BURVG|nr:hypothetical protein Bcep1808_6151 [Burkholderia vietnamiensis G4]
MVVFEPKYYPIGPHAIPGFARRNHYGDLWVEANEMLRLMKELRRQGPHLLHEKRPGVRYAVVSPHHRRRPFFPVFPFPAARSADSIKAGGTAPLRPTPCSHPSDDGQSTQKWRRNIVGT